MCANCFKNCRECTDKEFNVLIYAYIIVSLHVWIKMYRRNFILKCHDKISLRCDKCCCWYLQIKEKCLQDYTYALLCTYLVQIFKKYFSILKISDEICTYLFWKIDLFYAYLLCFQNLCKSDESGANLISIAYLLLG